MIIISDKEIILHLSSGPKTAQEVAELMGVRKRSINRHLTDLTRQKKILCTLNLTGDMRSPLYKVKP